MKTFLPVIAASLLLAQEQTLGQAQAFIDLDAKFVPGQSQVWSPLFQATWDKMNSLHQGKISQIEPPNALMQSLDQFNWDDESVMPTEGWATYSGPASKAFIATVEQELRTRFAIDPSRLRLKADPTSNLLVGALNRNLQFPRQFFRSKAKPLEFTDGLGKKRDVTFFGTAGKLSSRYKSNVRLLSYDEEKQSFLLKLQTRAKEENLIIVHGMEGESFASVIEDARKALETPTVPPIKQPMRESDVFKAPLVSFSSETDFTNQLTGLRTYQDEPTPWIISSAFQFTQFELSEKGAKIKIATATSESPFGAPPKPQFARKPVELICDGPFLVFAWREGANWPYLAIRIDGSSGMTTFK